MPDSVPSLDSCTDRQYFLSRLVFVRDPTKDVPKWVKKQAGVKLVLGIKNPNDCSNEELQQFLEIAQRITTAHDQCFDKKLRVQRMVVAQKTPDGIWNVFSPIQHPNQIQHFQNLTDLGETLTALYSKKDGDTIAARDVGTV